MLKKSELEKIEKNYKNTYRAITVLDDNNELKKSFENNISGMEDVMEIIGYKRENFIELKNSVLEQYNINLYYKWYELNKVIDEIEGRHKIFLYDNYFNIDNIINNYDFDRRFDLLVNLKYEIGKEIESQNNIKKSLENQLKIMTA